MSVTIAAWPIPHVSPTDAAKLLAAVKVTSRAAMEPIGANVLAALKLTSLASIEVTGFGLIRAYCPFSHVSPAFAENVLASVKVTLRASIAVS